MSGLMISKMMMINVSLRLMALIPLSMINPIKMVISPTISTLEEANVLA
jgi:hypothetical protein